MMTDDYYKHNDIAGLMAFVAQQPDPFIDALMLNTIAFQLADERRALARSRAAHQARPNGVKSPAEASGIFRQLAYREAESAAAANEYLRPRTGATGQIRQMPTRPIRT